MIHINGAKIIPPSLFKFRGSGVNTIIIYVGGGIIDLINNNDMHYIIVPSYFYICFLFRKNMFTCLYYTQMKTKIYNSNGRSTYNNIFYYFTLNTINYIVIFKHKLEETFCVCGYNFYVK